MKRTLAFAFFVFICLSATKAQEVKAISFNIRYNGYYANDGDYSWENRAPSVLKMIGNEQPDVMGLQEALEDQLTLIDNTFLSNYRRVGVGRDNGLSEGEHMAIYYNLNTMVLVDYQTRWLSATPRMVSKGWDAACMRTVTIAHFREKSTGKEFWYFNTHLDHEGQVAREESVKLLAKMISQIVPAGVPVILGGDMNSTIDSPIFASLFEIGLRSARDLAKESDNKDTYNAFGKETSKMIDHFFVRNLTPSRFITLDGDYGIRYISDHYPIVINFTL